MTKIILQKQAAVAILTLNDPDQLNAMDVAMGQEFSRALDDIARDSQVRAVVLTGAGRAFSSGGNLAMLKAMMGKDGAANSRALRKFYPLFLKVRDIPQPVIAAINGAAVGAGFCMALACDIRYAADTAKLGANFARIGLAPGMAGTYLTTRLAGPQAAAEILLTGRLFSAAEAQALGLVNKVVAADELLAQALETAAAIAGNGPIAVHHIKRGIQKALHVTFDEMLDYDSHCQAECFLSQDIVEGVAAAQDKRPPRFTGS